MRKLTSREKFLLHLLAVVLLVYVGGVQLLLPKYRAYDEHQFSLDELKTEEAGIKAQLSSQKALETHLQELQAKYATEKGRLLEKLPNEAIDRMLTELCFRHGITPSALNIADQAGENLPKNVTIKTVTISAEADRKAVTALLGEANAMTGVAVTDVLYYDGELPQVDLDFMVYMSK